MALAPRVALACACMLLAGGTAPAWAADEHIAVLHPDGHIRREPLHAGPSAFPAPARAARASRPATPTARIAVHRTAISELRRIHAGGHLSDAGFKADKSAWYAAQRAARKLSGTRRTQLAAVMAILNGIAARGKLTASRVAPLWTTLERNTEWWTTAPWIPASGERVGFSEDDLVWQFYPGSGLQIQWLGTFGQLNWLIQSTSQSNVQRASRMVDEILPLASSRAGGLAWEYEFPFDGGAPPWTSSLSQGTGLQALARSARRLGRQADILPVTQKALKLFQVAPPQGVRVAVPGGLHYVQYSFAPGLRILNGFIQSLVGLYDYASITGDQTAQSLFARGETAAERETPSYDTGAWSLYERGSGSYESNLNYHELLRDFLSNLCQRTDVAVFCDTAAHFTADLTTPPKLAVPAQRLRPGRLGVLRVRLDKISSLSLRVTHDGQTVLARSLGTVGHGTIAVRWAVPRHTGSYAVSVSARDLAGNIGTASGTVRVRRG